MSNFAKKFTSTGIALLIASTGAFASGTSAGVLPKNFSGSGVNKKLACYWNKIPKPMKILGEIGLIGTPFALGGYAIRSIGVNKDKHVEITPTKNDTTVKLSYDERVRHAKVHILEKCKEIYGNGAGLSELDKLKIFILKFIMLEAVDRYGVPYKDCIYLTDLIGHSEENIRTKLNKLDRTAVFSLAQTVDRITYFIKSVCSNGHFITRYLQCIQENNLEYTDGVSDHLAKNVAGINTLFNSHKAFNNKNFIDWLNNIIVHSIWNKLGTMDQEALKSKNMHIEKTLGFGASGVVYLCKDTQGKQFAVKVISNNNDTAENENNIYATIRTIVSDNVIKYEDKFNNSDAIYLFMEYIDDSKELTEATPKDINEVLDWSIQIFAGLKELHDKNIAHRDIKPGNIIMSENNQIRICDFGLAKRANLTKTVCGTIPMLAPEVFPKSKLEELSGCGHTYNGKKADVYSAGLVVYCLLTGKGLDDLDGIKGNPNKVSNPDRFGESISENMKKFFERCLDSNPDSRCTADGALDLLRECQKEESEKGQQIL